MGNYSFNDLQGKVCAITGGAGVIGLSLSKGLAAAGIKMAILDLNQEAADKASAEVQEFSGTPSIGVGANVLDKESLLNAKAVIDSKLGKIDILINCAGGNSPKATTADEFITDANAGSLERTFFGLDIEGFRKVFDLNFLGTVLPTMVLTTDMVEKRAGCIINISSMNAFRPLTKIPAYSAAKAGINNLTEWLAVHFAKVNIRVNAIAPGFFLTNQNRFLLTDEKTGELTARGNKVINGIPMGKFGDPEDLNGTVVFLASEMAKYVTGVIIPIDGGFNAYSGV